MANEPWPWYLSGPLIGLTVPLLLLLGNRLFGISSTLRHVCAATVPGKSGFLRYDWRAEGAWNLAFALGIAIGGVLCATVLADPEPFSIAASTRADLEALGFSRFDDIAPPEIFSWEALRNPAAWVVLAGGGFLVGFGARWGSGCTSGHAIFGLSNLQLPSLVAVCGFFAGGVFATHVILPVLFS